MRFEADAIEMEEAREVVTQRLLFVTVKPLQVSRDHEDKGIAWDATEVGHREEGLVKDLLDDHDDGAQIFSLQNELLDMVDSVNATVTFWGSEVLVLVTLLIYTDINL